MRARHLRAPSPYPFRAPFKFEDFDQGAAGVAYYDLSDGNSGGEYRATDVDIEACDEGGFNIGWVYPGEWLKYTVNPSQSGAYTLEFRVASEGAGGTFHLEVNGVDRTGPISIPDTGGWQNWTTVTKSGVNLSAGSQTWRLVVDAVGGGGTSGTSTTSASPGRHRAAPHRRPYRGTPIALPGTMQLEDFDNGGEGNAYHDLSAGNEGGEYRSTGVDVESTTDAGGGYNVGYVIRRRVAELHRQRRVGGHLRHRGSCRIAGSGRHIPPRGERRQQDRCFHRPGHGWLARLGDASQVGDHALGGTAGIQAGHGLGRLIRCGRELQLPSRRGRNGMAGGGGSTPYTGTAVALPGTVQFEAFDNGGEGVAFHDLSA